MLIIINRSVMVVEILDQKTQVSYCAITMFVVCTHMLFSRFGMQAVCTNMHCRKLGDAQALRVSAKFESFATQKIKKERAMQRASENML